MFAFQGEFSALTAAALWAFASLLFGRLGTRLSPLVLNITKGLVAIAFITLTLLVQPTLLSSTLPPTAVLLLIISGVIGIGLGDTAYFATINALGARQALLLETLAPPSSALLALAFLQEQLPAIAWLGIIITPLGIAWVISERETQVAAKHIRRGTLFGIASALAQATGGMLSRAALAGTEVDPLWSTLIRLVAGLVCMGMIAFIRPQMSRGIQHLKSPKLLAGVVIAAFFGTYLGLWLQQIAFKFAPTGIAQALLATSPMFALPMAILMGERVSWRAGIGAAIAIIGVSLLFVQAV